MTPVCPASLGSLPTPIDTFEVTEHPATGSEETEAIVDIVSYLGALLRSI
jgi:hypothetical protein